MIETTFRSSPTFHLPDPRGRQLLRAALGLRGAIPRRDALGVLLGALGTIACSLDSQFVGPQMVPWDVVAMFSGLGSCVFLSVAEKMRHTMYPSVFFCAVQLQIALYSFIAAWLFDGITPELSRDPVTTLHLLSQWYAFSTLRHTLPNAVGTAAQERGVFGWLVVSLPGRCQ